ncbi:Detected protein of confused Function [Hibiscus syriacus]|uniref:Detected protein of confused Function n=1 Tax=Hibiscus syriacus TaxID=106335 RepID=A0A6A3B732_HIBSY|nr:Detected protein of confused Function [Hibiscus syriacus]
MSLRDVNSDKARMTIRAFHDQEGGGGAAISIRGDQWSSSTYWSSSEASEQLVEAASPISSRPPAGNLDEFTRLASVGGGDELGLGDSGGGGGGGAGGNWWPCQETLALLKIRSDMDATFRDATVKGPLWEDVSRKLAEVGYKRSAKKCREKFENVHKYYKRTKETRAGRQDGKTYKFFNQLEALQTTSATAPPSVSIPVTPATVATATVLDVAPFSVGIPMPISSTIIQPTTAIRMSSSLLAIHGSAPAPVPMQVPAAVPPVTAAAAAATAAPFGVSFSSNSSTFSQGFDDDDDEEDEVRGEQSSMAGTSRKRKRSSSRGDGTTTKRIMVFFEGLMKQVMQKQEAMQQRFLEALEKREQDRTVREEAWKRQEMARLSREHELMAQERVIPASRDAAIISLLQKITGETIQLPTTVTIPAAPPPPPSVSVIRPEVPLPTSAPPSHKPPSLPQEQQQQPSSHTLHNQFHQHQQHQLRNIEVSRHQQQPISSVVVMAIPEQQVPHQKIGGNGSMEPASSRWPKAEVLELINLRSRLEAGYQEAGPKGPLWEEISAGMSRLGYKRSAKRCKEKWENINKYFKKVKESRKTRPEDAKTCPYFHQLDALYRKKILGGGTSNGSFTDHNRAGEETSGQRQDPRPSTAAGLRQSENETGPTSDVVTNKDGGAKKVNLFFTYQLLHIH